MRCLAFFLLLFVTAACSDILGGEDRGRPITLDSDLERDALIWASAGIFPEVMPSPAAAPHTLGAGSTLKLKPQDILGDYEKGDSVVIIVILPTPNSAISVEYRTFNFAYSDLRDIGFLVEIGPEA